MIAKCGIIVYGVYCTCGHRSKVEKGPKCEGTLVSLPLNRCTGGHGVRQFLQLSPRPILMEPSSSSSSPPLSHWPHFSPLSTSESDSRVVFVHVSTLFHTFALFCKLLHTFAPDTFLIGISSFALCLLSTDFRIFIVITQRWFLDIHWPGFTWNDEDTKIPIKIKLVFLFPVWLEQDRAMCSASSRKMVR